MWIKVAAAGGIILRRISIFHLSGTAFGSINELVQGIAAQHSDKRLAFDKVLAQLLRKFNIMLNALAYKHPMGWRHLIDCK